LETTDRMDVEKDESVENTFGPNPLRHDSQLSVEHAQRKHLLDSRGVLLRSNFLMTNNDTMPVLNRTLLLNKTLYEEPTVPYVPPLFLLIMCERTPLMRYTSIDSDRMHAMKRSVDNIQTINSTQVTAVKATVGEDNPKVKNTEYVLKDNVALIMKLLLYADLLPDSMQQSFIRLEHSGSLQSMFDETFPTPALKIGCLARLTFGSMNKRNRALNYLHGNSICNSDLYAINYSSNSCATTITRYLEPLFSHSLEIQKAWSVDTVKTNKTNDNGIFDVNFHLIDREPELASTNDYDDRPIFIAGSTDGRTNQRVRTPIKERTSRISHLTVHDVCHFFQNPTLYADRNGAAQLQSLPVVYIRYERDFFCMSGCTEYNKEYALFHIYYVWSEHLANNLNRISESVNNADKTDNYTLRMCVCNGFENQTAAYLRMLTDAKTCFWKKQSHTYVRLVLNAAQDDKTYSRCVLYSLLRQEISSSKVSMLSHIEGSRKTVDGRLNMFENSITIDCAKLAEDLDENVSAFAAAYKRIRQDGTSYANADGATNISDKILCTRQHDVGNMLLKFKEEHIVETAYNMASDLYVGILDIYGAGETNATVARFDPISNYLFVNSLVNMSVYTSSATFDTDVYALIKKNNVDDVKLVPAPYTFHQEGIHYAQEGIEICEFDMDSAYPTIVEAFNISPETTVVMPKKDFANIAKQLEKVFWSKEEGPFVLDRWYFVVPYVDAPEELVIVSLLPCVYKGCMSTAFNALVLKRRTRSKMFNHFYKRLSNMLCGYMAKKESDVFAVHCLAAASSLCHTAIRTTLNNLRDSAKLLRVQTDGGIVRATQKVNLLAAELQKVFSDTMDSLLNKNITKCSVNDTLLKLRIRNVNMCFIAGQNKYAIRYLDGKKVLKGHDGKFSPSTWALTAVTEAVAETVDAISQAGYECRCESVITKLMNVICKRMINNRLNNGDTDEMYFFERMAPLEDRYEEKRILDIEELKYNQHCRFGDTIPLWPVIVVEGETMTKGYVCKPARLGTCVIVDRFAVLKNLINAWAIELCRSQCFDFCTDWKVDKNYTSLFNKILWRVGYDYCNLIYNSDQHISAGTK